MNKAQFNFINVSVFYNRQCWHLLLLDCIAGIIDLLNIDTDQKPYLIYLNADKGNNIRFSPGFNSGDCDHVLEQLKDRLKTYLLAYPSPTDPVIFPLQNIFMDFPNNSIQYNLYLQPIPCPAFPIRQLVSKHILEVLADDIIDPESIFAFDLYLHFQYLKSFQEVHSFESLLETLKVKLNKSRSRSINRVSMPDAFVDMRDSFLKNREVISEINKIVFTINENQEMQFLLDWEVEFKKIMIGETHLSRPEIVLDIIQEHLGMTEVQKLFVLYAVIENFAEVEIEN